MFIPPAKDGKHDPYLEERYTGGLILADWYQMTVTRFEADKKK